MPDDAPRVLAVGIGPAARDLVSEAARSAIEGAERVFLRTERHPSAGFVFDLAPGRVVSFDYIYEEAATFAEVYKQILEVLVSAASETRVPGGVVYVLPGSPLVAERTVELLRSDRRVNLTVVPAMSFLDLVWDRLGVDPVSASVRIVDGTEFASQAAGQRGPLLVAQTHSRAILSEVKLAVEQPVAGDRAGVLLHHLGLEDEVVRPVAWSELDRVGDIEPDHLTSMWIDELDAPVAGEMVRLVELVRTLRARCPWDQRQTHGSLGRHLLEEAYEALDAIEDVAAADPDVPEEAISHLEEELGDLVFQVVFHSALAAEEGWFTLADVAASLIDKLVGRHPHVFGDAVADTPEDVARRWEVLKREEQGRSGVTEGIPRTFPALALSAKLQRKADSFGLADRGPEKDLEVIRGVIDRLAMAQAGSSGETLEAERSTVELVGEALFVLADLARRAGVDPESALRARAMRLVAEIRDAEKTADQAPSGVLRAD